MDNYKRLNYYRQVPAQVLEELRTTAGGLKPKEAAERLEHMGPNMLHKAHRESTLVTFARQFKNLLVVILLVSAGISLYLHDGKTATIMIAIALINTLVGFFQEHKAETLFASLQQLMVPQAKVIRGGKLAEINAVELVLGDVVYIEEGDSVPADLRILDEEELASNDFALTGESQPSRKFVHAIADDVPLGSRHNLLFMGTTVAIGHGHGVVVGTGMNTELGRIASLSQVTNTDSSPLQKEMNNLAKRLVQGTIILAVLLTAIAFKTTALGLHGALLFAIAIAAAMIPNGLAAEVNITLAQTAARMAKARALVKKLSAVETLGATNIILTDKTGTLTKNEMTVTSLLIGKTEYAVTGTGYETNGTVTDAKGKPLNSEALREMHLFFETAAMASNAHVNPPDDQHATWYVVGDPTEGALITLVRKAGLDPNKLDELNQEVKEFQFDSARKLMSSVRRYNDKIIVFAKGAPEAILERSSNLYDHTFERRMTIGDRKRLRAYNDKLARDAMRNLAFAYRILPARTDLTKLDMNKVEQDFTFLGMVSMLDPLREQVPEAMLAARGAHIKVSVVTGDNPTTAQAIARHAELVGNPDDITVILGEELAQLADSQILQLVERGGTVFSRVAPEDKLRIVEIAKQSGRVVAVTGDGINDAPALKRADIGVAMGKTGTDVAKDAAEIVLLDDSFSTLVGATEQGRLTFRNIRKAARCALTDNAGELFLILISLAAKVAFHVPLAITAIQILAIDIIAEMFPITALGWDSAQRNLMRDAPRKLSDHIINKKAVAEFVSFGLLSASLAYLNFLFFFARRGISPRFIDVGSTLYFKATILTYVTVVLCQFMNLLLVRSDEHESFFTRYIWSNRKLLVAFGISFFCIANIIYNPWVSPYFHAGPLTFVDILTAVGTATIYSIVRLIERQGRKHTRHILLRDHSPDTLKTHPKLA